jgi:hypothetical protein
VKKDERFERFLKSARHGRPSTNVEAPFAFSTRVASRVLNADREEPLLLWERLAFKGLALALVLAFAVGTGVIRIKSSRPSTLADFAGLAEPQENLW